MKLSLAEIHALNTGRADDALKAKAKEVEEARKTRSTEKAVKAEKPAPKK